MIQIMIDTDVNAPGCPCQIVGIETGPDGTQKQIGTILVQSDWEYCGVASSFGWSLRVVQQKRKRCSHTGDGTTDCEKCGVKAGAFIESAYDFLTSNDGLTVEDPGYFSE